LAGRPYDLPPLRLDHLIRMSDDTGIFQHALFNVPNFQEGYCTDDNARALILTVLLEELEENSPHLINAATTYAAFLQYAFDPKLNRFRNFMEFNRSWKEEAISEDCCGRALLALGTCVGRSKNLLTAARARLAGGDFEQARRGAEESLAALSAALRWKPCGAPAGQSSTRSSILRSWTGATRTTGWSLRCSGPSCGRSTT